MTEAEWLASDDPERMVEFIDRVHPPSRRKCRLLSCAACRQLGQLLVHPQSVLAVETAERWADGESSDDELLQAWLDAGPSTLFGSASRTESPEFEAALAAMNAANPKPDGRSDVGPLWSALSVIEDVIEATGRVAAEPGSSDWWKEAAMTVGATLNGLIRDIFGNPFRPVAVDPRWLTSTVVELARGIYEDRAFDRLPILADALQDAGCDSDDVLSHCRGPGPHVRGCWVVDLILGKA